MLKNKKKNKYFFLLSVIIFLYLPIISLVVFSFNESEGRISSLVHFNKFGFKWYSRILTDQSIKSSIIVTLHIAFLSTFCSVFLGTLSAISLMYYNKKWRKLVLNANQLSMVIPEIINALALFVFFNFISLKNSFLRMLLAHISFSIPYVLISVYNKCSSLDIDLLHSASDLGATPFQTLRKVILPQLKGVIIASSCISFGLSFDDFIISYFVGGSDYQNISAYIYSLKGTVNPTINALSSILILFFLLKILFDFYKLRKKIY
ncbi:ABC transporter permease [Candidatus Phytoplasma pini]|uniref:ABC-type spermidine/putrescine transport, permease protein II n=1 Tax=Candidatus Phytoplasma pini TaxID=267362 RepID=A0A559KIW3_9MOLU|nr:ABC transporter permease [Candidatus Phytoplasma pini]TVY12074.1 ABC-type spermidine/putrescine transport, permease protein II [Candidatus Phytoplasma pini]